MPILYVDLVLSLSQLGNWFFFFSRRERISYFGIVLALDHFMDGTGQECPINFT